MLVAIGMALLSDVILMLDNVRGDIRRNLTNAANAAGTVASAAVVFRDAKAARESLRMFEVYPEIEAAAVYSNDGSRLAQYGDAGRLPGNAQEIESANGEITLLARATTLHLPIIVDDAPVGTLYLRARLETYWQTYFTSIATTFLVALSAGTLALLLAMRYLNRIIQPVRMLADAANDARLRQDFIPRTIPAADDEIGDLVRNFNALLAEVESSRKALLSQHDVLEKQVAERTAALLAAKETADAASAAKSRFLAAASHDLRQPIHAMRLFQEALSNTPLNAEQRRISDYLSLSTRNLTEILNTLLDVSRLDAGSVRAQPECVTAAALLCDIEAEFAPLALAKGLRFKFFFPRQELRLYTDAKLLYSMLRNMIDNAIKYTTAGGVLIGFRRRRGRALIQIWDTGIGIAPDHLAAIFDEYFQAGNPQRDRANGLGLGLAIAQRVASILETRVRCHSRLGKGSLFEFSIALAADASRRALPAEPSAPVAKAAPRLAGRHVVVVEDDMMAAKALEISLAAYALRVTTFPDAERALADPRIDQADFYAVDFRLPGQNGVQFLETLSTRTKRPISAALLTGETGQTALAALRSPRWRILLKPVDMASLLAEIDAQCAVQNDDQPGVRRAWAGG